MPRNKDDKQLYDYNIYKIPVEKADEFKDYLETRQFEEIPLKDSSIKNPNEFSFVLMFCDKNNKRGSAWVQLLSSCAEWDLTQELKIYGAALICKSKQDCFIVSYGNAHFYISNYCEYNFGVSIAERLINLDSVKSQQNVSQGSKISKTYMDYFTGATLTYRSGEIPTYIRGNSINKKDWGDVINCGTSAQFKWEEKPTEIGNKLNLLSMVLDTKANISLPRLIKLDEDEDADKIDELNKKLAASIATYDKMQPMSALVNVPSFYMAGTKLIQNDSVKFKLSCNHKRKEYDGELSIAAINEFLQEKQLDINNVIKNINISVEYANDSWTPPKPITEYIEFVTDDNFCLRNGNWCSFNNAYLERIFSEANRIPFVNCSEKPYLLSKSGLVIYAKKKGIYIDCEKQPYETYYNNLLAENLSLICIHPQTVPIDSSNNRRYKLEICDLYGNNTMYFVKIGEPVDFAFAIDQAMITLDKIEHENGKTLLPNGDVVTPKIFEFLMVFDSRKNSVKAWEDIYSINFLIHLTELKQRLNFTDISLSIKFIYAS